MGVAQDGFFHEDRRLLYSRNQNDSTHIANQVHHQNVQTFSFLWKKAIEIVRHGERFPPKCSWCRTISDAFVGFLRRERQSLTINLQCLQRGLNPFICNCTYWKSRSKPFTLTRIYSRCPINVSKDIHGKSALVYANRDQHNATQEHGYVTPTWPS